MIATANGRFHVTIRVEGSPKRRRITRHGESQRNACLIGQEDVQGPSSLMVSCGKSRGYWNVQRRMRRAARMVDEQE